MSIIDAVLNATAVWVILKAVEVLPLAAYDFHAFVKERFTPMEGKLSQRFDKIRGKLEFLFSGAGFFQFSLWRRSKRLFLIAILLPVTSFVLEILSLFLGDETRVCLTSRDPNVVKAPALRLFGEGEREVNVDELNYEVLVGGLPWHPCLQRQSTYSGVEFIATMCSNVHRVVEIMVSIELLFPDNERVAIFLGEPRKSGLHFVLSVFSLPFKDNFSDFALAGSLSIRSHVVVNGKNTLTNNAVQAFSFGETTIVEICNDVKALENFTNSVPSEFYVGSDWLWTVWANLEDFRAGSSHLIYSIISQSRKVGLRTAAEMSEIYVNGTVQDVDISCQEDYFLPRTVSIIIITTGVVLRLFLGALPTSVSSAEYALKACQNGEESHDSTEFNTEQQRPTQVLPSDIGSGVPGWEGESRT